MHWPNSRDALTFVKGCGQVEFFRDESGQDLLEYALLLAFIAIAGAAAFLGMSKNANTLWSVANSNLAAGNAAGS